ncbi:MAG: SAM-dependent methyltransferase [Clostridia bacterium]|nr:SAM-dependent methyltransferase [Clostridia bacterium]
MLTPRLECIVRHTKGKIIADIGTDHAYIPIYLIENNLCDYVIAGDIRTGPTEIAKTNVKNHNLSDKIEVRLGSGLSVLNENEADTIIIAGMGGQLITEIIEANLKIAHKCRLVLQPMNAQYELRKYLSDNGFKITDEDIAVEDFKVYNIINAKKGHETNLKDDIEYHLPKYLKTNKYYKKLYEKKYREFTKVINGLENSNDIDYKKLNLYKNWLKELENYES